jgi:hypothetical protein
VLPLFLPLPLAPRGHLGSGHSIHFTDFYKVLITVKDKTDRDGL